MLRRTFIAAFAASSIATTALAGGHSKDIVDTAVGAGSFGTLVAAVQAAGLVEVLKGEGPFTVFAPTDEAFAALPAGTVETLLKPENKEKLVSILTYHVLAGKVMSSDIAGKMLEVQMVNGSTAKIDATNGVGGQIDGSEPRLFLIYPAGNFIEASTDTPYFQIGETKYGRPIMLRAYNAEMSWEAAIKLLLISFDSTVKANLSVGLPLDMLAYQKDSLECLHRDRITSDDPYFLSVSNGWGEALKSAFDQLPDFKF
jgi:predicted proteasome-type protease